MLETWGHKQGSLQIILKKANNEQEQDDNDWAHALKTNDEK